MSETKHTPGPWEVLEKPTSIGRCFVVGPPEINVLGHGGACLYDDDTTLNPHTHEEVAANARLIAASPELLEACKLARESLTPARNDEEMTAINALNSAIAKAERRQS